MPDRYHDGAHRVSAMRDRDDFYTTEPAGTRALLAVEGFPVMPQAGANIWEPACGDGAIVKELEAAGHSVLATDLVDRGAGTPRRDFLMEWCHNQAGHLVTNPPFKLFSEFAIKARQLVPGKVCLLGKLTALEGNGRSEVLEATGLSRVWVFRDRVQTTRRGTDKGKGGGSMLAMAWFVWDPDQPPVDGFWQGGWIEAKGHR